MHCTEQRTHALQAIAAEAVPETTDLWPAIESRLHHARRRHRLGASPWLAPGAAAVALVAVLAVGLLVWWTPPEAVSAETILDRAEAMADSPTSVQTYHLLMSHIIPAKAPGLTISSEVWYGGPDRQRTSERTTDASGALVSSQEVVFNGADTWIAHTEHGQTQVVHTIGTTWTRPADDPSSQTSLSDLLSRYGGKGCTAVRREAAEATVAGQATYVVNVAPRIGGCGPSTAASPAAVAAPSPAPVRVSGEITSGRIVGRQPLVQVWVDMHSFLPLKIEVHDASGAVLDRSEVTHIDYNQPIAAETFTYAPPPGVTVSTFHGGDGAQVKRTLAGPGDEGPGTRDKQVLR